jgi:transcriptional regulator
MVLKAIEAVGPLHGYGIARRLEEVSWGRLQLNEGTVYTALMRLKRQGLITASWGASENNRRARFYAMTRAGRRRLVRETDSWERIAGIMSRVLQLKPRKT